MLEFDVYLNEKAKVEGHVLNPSTSKEKNSVEFLKKHYGAQVIKSRADIHAIAGKNDKIVYAATCDGKTILAGEGNVNRAYVAVDGGDATAIHYKKLKVLMSRRASLKWEAVMIKAKSKIDADRIEKDMHAKIGVGSKGDGMDSHNLNNAVEKYVNKMGGTTDILKRFLKAAIYSGQDPVGIIRTWGKQGVITREEIKELQNILDINVSGVKVKAGRIRESKDYYTLQEVFDILYE